MNRDERTSQRRHIVDACIKVASNKGLSDAVGVLRGTLFLASEPMSMDELVAETGYSKSTVSSNMSLLENLGLARRVVIPGDKRYHYSPVTDPDSLKKAMLINVRNEILLLMAALDRTEKDIEKDIGNYIDTDDTSSKAVLEKIGKIRQFYAQTDRLLDLVSQYTTEELIALLEKNVPFEEELAWVGQTDPAASPLGKVPYLK
ncbi:MAG: ArsR family transcriptional regulator, partial [Methanothrix sp.]|nr:ArsR family transcriptional regulator [Methanothrix sp.]